MTDSRPLDDEMMKTESITDFIIDGKKVELLNEKWDVLVILDACRYDKFKKLYDGKNKDNLKKAISPACHTREFLEKIFTKKYDDIIYISTNPFINSYGIKLSNKQKFNPKNKFKKIVDLWNLVWDDDLGTVHPKKVNFVAKEYLEKSDNRLIIHYMQPHFPYIFYGGFKRTGSNKKKNKMKRRILDKTIEITKKIIGQKGFWKIGGVFGQLPKGGQGWIWFNYGTKGIIKGYEEDLKLVIGYVKKLINDFPDKNFLIIADHGERLGEHNRFFHEGRRDKEVIEVPWLEIYGKKEESG